MNVLLLADGRFPAGGHANSAGTESAITHGLVTDVASLEMFLAGRLATTGAVEAAFAAHATAAVHAPGDPEPELARLDAEYEARLASPRARAVSLQLGRQLARAARAVWPHPALAVPHHQPVTLGAACAAAGGTAEEAAAIAVHHLASAITTAAVRMLGLDPLAVAAVHARAVAGFTYSPGDLPALTTTLTEILAEDHGRWDARLFVA